MGVVPLCFCVCERDNFGLLFKFCLGHGICAALCFMIFWFLSVGTGSRN